MPIKAVIFDFDGTIANSSKAIIEVLGELSKEYNLPEIDKNDLTKFRKMSFRQILDQAGISKIKLFFFVRKARKLLKERISEVHPYQGIKEVLETLHSQGLTLGIVTSNTEENVNQFLKNNKIEVIDFVNSEPGLFGKDKVINKCIKRMNLQKDEVIYVGDEIRDIEAAHKSGIKIISVSWGYNDEELLKKYDPEYIIETPNQLLKILKS